MTNSPFPATTSAAAITWPVSIIGTKRLCPFESGHSRPIKRRRIRVYNKKRRIWVDNSGDGIDVPGSTGNEEHQPLAGAEQYSASATYFEDPYDYDFDIDPKSVTGIRQAAIFIPGRTNSANASKSSSVSGSKSTSRSSCSNQNSRFNPLSTLNRGSRTTQHVGSDEASLMRGLGIGMFNNLGSGCIIRGVSQEVAKIDSDMRSSSFAGFRACNKPDSEEDDGSDGDSDTSPNSAGSSFPNRGSPSTRHSGTNSDDSDTLSVIPAPELPFPKGNVLGSLIKKMREELGMEASEDYDFDTLLIIPAPELPFPEGNAIASLVGNMRLNFDPTPTDPN
ncbi:hypothetical protein GGH92_001274 [Coemansia sp. RSA 2673]|nr:hypothetical protein GGH92_001274 [Coemansia sp. RSA 2673]